MKRKPVVYTFKDESDCKDFLAFASGKGLRIVENSNYHVQIYDDEFDKEKPVASILDIENVELQVYKGKRVIDIAEDYIRQRST